jgi:glycosyltransferase involved in cell wall biosynthesis
MPEEELISIVIPAYNEEQRLPASLDKIVAFLKEKNYKSEIIVVDDGSSDKTLEVVKDYSTHNHSVAKIRIIQNPRNMGKGYSVRNGMLQAAGRLILFTDADLSAPIEEAPKLIDPILRGECDVAIGSRGLKESVIPVRQPILRELSGRIFNLFVRAISGLKIKDTQCGFKAFRREAAAEAFTWQTIYGFGFDVEVLYIAQQRGWRIREVPVVWRNVLGTKVRVLSDSWVMFWDLFKIRLNHLQRKYGK